MADDVDPLAAGFAISVVKATADAFERVNREAQIRALVALAKLFDIDQEVVERLGG